jgi:hypothetical protein
MLIPSKHLGYQAGVRLYHGKASAPQAPDYSQAAKDTAAGNKEMAEYTTKANRIDQFNPYGSLTYNQDPTGKWSQTTQLSDVGKQQFDLQNQLQTKYGETANKGFDSVRGIFENPSIDQSLLPKAPINAGMTAQQAMMSRLQPTLDRNDEALRTRLANQGIGLGSTAYNREQNLAGQNANDLYLQSAMQGIGLDQNARKDALNEAYAAQSRPLDLINSLRTGNQVQSPQFANYAQQATTQGPDMLNAANMKYGAEMDAVNAQNEATSGLIGGIAGMGMGLAGLPGAGGSIFKGAKGLFRG